MMERLDSGCFCNLDSIGREKPHHVVIRHDAGLHPMGLGHGPTQPQKHHKEVQAEGIVLGGRFARVGGEDARM